MFNKVIDLGFAVIENCDKDHSAFWNSALTNQILTADEIGQVEKTMVSMERTPTIYFEHRPLLNPLINILEQKGYSKNFEDSWMFYDGRQISQRYFDSVEKVKNNKDLQVYLNTFNGCYQNNDPQNPYGELGSYLEVAKDVWLKHHSITNYENIGYVSNVGSLRSVRGEGFGKAATIKESGLRLSFQRLPTLKTLAS